MRKNTQNVLLLAAVLVSLTVVLLLTLIILLLVARKAPVTVDPGQVACTDDAMICPDGSAVGRTGPKCEFAPCPVIPGGVGTLKGNVVTDPTCPVEASGVECEPPDYLYSSRGIIIYKAGGEEHSRVYFNPDGSYETKLPAGSYSVSLIPNGVDSSQVLPTEIVIVKNDTLFLSIDIDTGIR